MWTLGGVGVQFYSIACRHIGHSVGGNIKIWGAIRLLHFIFVRFHEN